MIGKATPSFNNHNSCLLSKATKHTGAERPDSPGQAHDLSRITGRAPAESSTSRVGYTSPTGSVTRSREIQGRPGACSYADFSGPNVRPFGENIALSLGP